MTFINEAHRQASIQNELNELKKTWNKDTDTTSNPIGATDLLEKVNASIARDREQANKSILDMEAKDFAVSDSDMDTVSGQLQNLGLSTVSGLSRIVGDIVETPFTAASYASLALLSDEDKEDYNTLKLATDKRKKGKKLSREEELEASEAAKRLDAENALGISANDLLATRQNALKVSNWINEATDLGDLVNRSEQDVLTKGLSEAYAGNSRDITEGLDKFMAFDGSSAEGLLQFAKGLGNLSLETGDALVSNPMGLATFITESAVPTIALGMKSMGAVALSNIGYGTDIYREGVQTFEKREGRLPTQEENNKMALAAGTAGAMEGIMDKFLLKGLGKSSSSIGTAAATEGATESVQTYIENYASNLNPEKVTGEEIYAAGIIGAASGATIRGVIDPEARAQVKEVGKKGLDAAKPVADKVKETANKASEKLEPIKTKVNEAVKDTKLGNVAEKFKEKRDTYLDSKEAEESFINEGGSEKIKDLEPKKTVELVEERNTQEEVSEQEKTDNVIVAKQAEAKVQEKLLNTIVDINALKDKGKLSSEDQTKLKKLITDLKKAKSEKDLISSSIQKIEQGVTLSEEEKSVAIELANEGSQKQSERVFNSFKANPDSFNEEQTEALIEGDNTLTEPQKKELKNHSKYLKIKKSISEVNQNILVGGKDESGRTFLGIQDYRNMMNAALNSGDTTRAAKVGGMLRSFAQRHTEKARYLSEAFETQNEQDIKYVKEVYGLNITPNSGNLVEAVKQEASLLQEATRANAELYSNFVNQQTTTKPQTSQKPETETQLTTEPKTQQTDTKTETQEDTLFDEPQTPDVSIEPQKQSKSEVDTLRDRLKNLETKGIKLHGNTLKSKAYQQLIKGETPSKTALKNLDKVISKKEQQTANTKVKEDKVKTNASVKTSKPKTQKTVNKTNPAKELLTSIQKEREKLRVDRENNKDSSKKRTELETKENSKLLKLSIPPHVTKETYSLGDSIVFQDDTNKGDIKLENKVAKSFMTKKLKSKLQSNPDFLYSMSKEYEVDMDSAFEKYFPNNTFTETEKLAAKELFDLDVKVEKSLNDNVFFKSKANYKYRNYFQYLVNEDGTLDPNVIGAITGGIFNWIDNEANSTLVNDGNTINRMLGRDTKKKATPEMFKLLWDKGNILDEVLNSLGQKIYENLGLQLNPKEAEINDLSKLKLALGSYGLAVMEDLGLVTFNVVQQKDIDNTFTNPSEYKQRKERTVNSKRNSLTFVRVAAVGKTVETTEPSENVKKILDANANFPDLNEAFFGTERLKVFPKFTFEPSKISDKVKNSNQVLSPEMKKSITKQTAKKIKPIKNNFTVFNFLNEDTQKSIAGFVDNIDTTVHATQRKAVETRNATIEREIADMKEFVSTMETKNKDHFFLKYTLWKNLRMGQEGVINLVNSKIHRQMFAMEDWETKIDLKNPDHVKEVSLSVADAFGVKVSAQTEKSSLRDMVEILKEKPELVRAIEAISDILTKEGKGLEDKSDEYNQIIKQALDAGGEKYRTLNGLVLAAQFMKAQAQGQQYIKTSFFRQADGINNGLSFGTLQYGGANAGKDTKGNPMIDPNDMDKRMKRTGLFTGGSYTSYGKYKEEGNLDAYESLAQKWDEEIDKLYSDNNRTSGFKQNPEKQKEQTRLREITLAAKSILGPLVELNEDGTVEVTKAGRALTKGPVTTTIYDAGAVSIREALSEAFMEKIYDDWTALAKNKNTTKAQVKEIYDKINIIVGEELMSTDNVTKRDLLEDTFPPKYVRIIRQAVEDTLGKALNNAIKSEFASFKQQSKNVRDTFSQIEKVYRNAENVLIEEKIQERKDNDDWVNGISALRVKEIDAIRKKLKPVAPIVDTLMSTNINDSLSLVAFKPQTQVSNNFRSEVKFRNAIGQKKSISRYGNSLQMKPLGSSASPILTQSLDGITSMLTMQNNAVLNLFDEIGSGIGNMKSAAQDMNKNFFEVNKNYSILESTKKAANRAYASLIELSKEHPDLREVALQYKRDMNEPRTQKEGPPLPSTKDNLNEAIRVSNQAKQDYLSKVTYVTQYNQENSGYVPPVNKNKPKETFNEVIDEVSTNTVEDIEELDRKLQSKNTDFNLEQSFTKYDNITKATTLEKFNMLDKVGTIKENAKHKEFLQNQLTKVINKVITPFNLHLAEELGSETRGQVNGMDVHIISELSNTAPIVSGTLGQGIKMSAIEVYVHELLHVITQALDTNSKLRNEIKKLWVKSKKHLSPKDFMNNPNLEEGSPEYTIEYEIAKERYDYIFTPRTDFRKKVKNPFTGEVKTIKKSNYLHEFLAFAGSNENFIKALNKVPLRDVRTGGLVLDKLMRVLDSLMFFIGKKFNKRKGLPVDKQMQELIVQLAQVENKKTNSLKQMIVRGLGVSDAVLRTGFNFTRDIVSAAGKSPILRTSKFTVLRIAGKSLKIIGDKNAKYIMSNMLDVRDKMFEGKLGVVASLASEMRGRTENNGKFYNMLVAKNKAIDITRREISEAIERNINEQFVTELTSEQKSNLTKILIKTDLAAIDDNLGTDVVLDILKNPNKIESYLNAEEAKLSQFGDNKNFYINHARNLGYFQVTGQSMLESGVIMNAKNISKLFFTNRKTPKNAKQAEPIIDTLASLYALYYSDPKTMADVGDIVRTELKEGEYTNAIVYSIGQHKALKRHSKEKVFKNADELMVKGYTPDIKNENCMIKLATLQDEETLLKQGYTRQLNPISRDKLDESTKPLYMYTSKDAGHVEYATGIVSLDNIKSTGVSMLDTKVNPTDNSNQNYSKFKMGKLINSKVNQFSDTFNSLPRNRNPKALNVASPVGTVNGTPKDFRYILSHNVKDAYLERVNDLDRVLGSMGSSIQSKHQAKIHNVKAINALYEQYKEDYQFNSKKYLVVSPNASDKRLKTIWNQLPEEAKEMAKAKFGEEKILVRNDILDLVFGYRKISATTAFAKEKEEQSAAEHIFTETVNMIFRGNGAKFAYKSGKIYGEFIGWAKDIIVIRSGMVTLSNIMSNMVTQSVYGVSPTQAVKDTYEAYREVHKYKKISKELEALQGKLKFGRGSAKTNEKIKSKIAELEDDKANSPVANLVEVGVLQNIIEDIDTDVDGFSYRGKFEQRIKKYTDKLPNVLTSSLNELTLGRTSKAYGFARYGAQVSDFAARYSVHKKLMEEGYSNQAAIEEVMDIFLNYDVPTHRNIQYLNDIGVLMFSKYLLRVQRQIARMFKKNPSRTISMLALQNIFGEVSDITDSMLFLGTSPLTRINNPLNLVDVWEQVFSIDLAAKAI